MEDEFIIKQVIAGHNQAYRFLVLRYQRSVFRYVHSFGLRKSHVEEIAQDVFVNAYKSLLNFDSRQSQFQTWLLVIAKNAALNALSKHSYQKEIFNDEGIDTVEVTTPLTLLENKVVKEMLNECMDQLPLQFKRVLTLFHLNEMSLEEISQVESCSLGTVKSRLHRAKNMLKELIIKKYGSELK